jgi:hypothetical protein
VPETIFVRLMWFGGILGAVWLAVWLAFSIGVWLLGVSPEAGRSLLSA